jgi:translation initiation factor IF-2
MESTLKGMLEPTYGEVLSGRAEVRAVFASSKLGKIAGVYVMEGNAWRDAQVKYCATTKSFLNPGFQFEAFSRMTLPKSLLASNAGLGIEGAVDFQVGDIIEFYRRERIN